MAKRPDKFTLRGRVLLLVEDPGQMRAQLAGADLACDEDVTLRDDISTDEITPAHLCFYFDETLGEVPYLGLKCGDDLPVTRGAVKNGGFVASVSGARRGKGSSREQSPYAELCAGLRLVIGKSFERIYKQNCQNLGLLTSTRFDLIEAIRAGAELDLEELCADEDPITRGIIRHGGLYAFNVARRSGEIRLPPITTPARPMTLAEKILARHFVVDPGADRIGVAAVAPGDAGFVRCDLRFSHEYVTPMASIFYEKFVGPETPVNDPASILFFEDHLTFIEEVMSEDKKRLGLLDLARGLRIRQAEFARRHGIRVHGPTPGSAAEAICHSKICESYALPGQVIVGTDSHTTHSGAVGCLAFGVGATDIFNAWVTKDVSVRVPETLKIVFDGTPRANVTAKDLILSVLAHPYVKMGRAIGKIIEYAGEAVRRMSIDERATLTNMAAEIGGFTGIVAPDETTAAFLVERRGLEPAEAQRWCREGAGDPDATYAEVLSFDTARISPMVALPGDPGNGVEIAALPGRVKVDIAYAGSCTAGKREDMDMYAAVLEHAAARGKKVHPDVAFYVQFGSKDVKDYCDRRGYLDLFRRSGARLVDPSCGACINAGPGASTSRSEVVVSAQNRNFPGRSGPGQMYLGSPYTVAASAVAGAITAFDPEVQ